MKGVLERKRTRDSSALGGGGKRARDNSAFGVGDGGGVAAPSVLERKRARDSSAFGGGDGGGKRAHDSSAFGGGDGGAVPSVLERKRVRDSSAVGGCNGGGGAALSPNSKAMMARIDWLEKAEAEAAAAAAVPVDYYERMEFRMENMRKKNRKPSPQHKMQLTSHTPSPLSHTPMELLPMGGSSTVKSDAPQKDGEDEDLPLIFHMDMD